MNRKIDPVTRDLSLFALPMLLGNILQSCYSMVDMAVVGQFVGREALAAVSNTSMICFISNSICIGFTVGYNVLIAKFRGAKNASAQRDTIRTMFALSIMGGILLTLLNYLLYQPVLHLMNIPAEAFPYAVEYMSIICAGNLFVFGYNAVCSIMRGLGDSRRPLYPLTMLQVYLYGLAIGYAIIISIMSIILLFSAMMKTSFAVIIIGVLWVFAPMFIPSSKTSSIINSILALLPAKAMDAFTVFSVYNSYNLFGNIISLPMVIALFSTCITIITLPLAYSRFRRHQVV